MTRLPSHIDFLYALEKTGIKLGLQNVRSLLHSIGNPEKAFTSIHIAGTNGKGSTAAMLGAILAASGYKTGLYTSPHLIDFRERIRIGGRAIPASELAYRTAGLKTMIKRTGATFFEAATAIAFQYFADERVDVAVVETGLGGRCDATNVLSPALSVITSIGLDHTNYLGSTHASIAGEKGGIIKRGVPCITGVPSGPALKILQKIARRQRARLLHSDLIPEVDVVGESLSGMTVAVHHRHGDCTTFFVELHGTYQRRNIGIVFAALGELASLHLFPRIRNASIQRGLERIVELSGLHGRFEVIEQTPATILDVAHNTEAVAALRLAWQSLFPRQGVVVFGVMKDKPFSMMTENLAPIARLAVAVQAQTSRSLPAEIVLSSLRTSGVPSIPGGGVAEGLRLARRMRRPGEPILVTGSHFVVGEALKIYGDI